jgi:hypothetical protein
MTPMTIGLTIVLALVILANRAFHFDNDISKGTDPDPWTSIDKIAHLFGGITICFMYLLAATYIWAAFALTVLIAGGGWEWSQEYRSKRDAIAVAVGALAAVLYVFLVRAVNP